MKKTIAFILFLSFCSYLEAQNNMPEYFGQQRIAIDFGVGYTYGFNSFTQSTPTFIDFKELRGFALNEGFGIKYFHRNRWVSAFHYYAYTPLYGVQLYHDFGSSKRRRNHLKSGDYFSGTFHFGRRKRIGQTRLQVNWFGGMSFQQVVGRSNDFNVDFGETELFKLEDNDTIYKKGLLPSLQAGYQIAFRGKHLGLSLMAFGNWGLRYYASTPFTAWVNYEQYNATVQSKGSFLAATLQCEFYIFNRKEQ